MFNSRFYTLTGMILLAALGRLVPHPWNFTPVAAMALFSGARFERRSHAFLVPTAALLLSDAVLGFHRTMPFVYAGFALTVIIGFLLTHRHSPLSIIVGSLAGSVLFFLVTNFGYWITTDAFPKTSSGLIQCYAVAIPFFRNSMAGDLVFSALLFGSFALAEKATPHLQRN